MFTLFCGADESNIISYYDVHNSRTLIFDLKNKIFSNGHIEENLFFCSRKSGFICILGGPVFVLPVKFGSNDTEWKFNKYNFNNLGLEKLAIMGKEYNVFRIQVADSGGWLWYLYSLEKGVLIIGSRDEENNKTAYVLQNECGLAANC